MKYWLLLLILPLLLAGCSDKVPATEPETFPSGSAGLFDPDHTLTEDTNGAVYTFLPDGDDYSAVLSLGKNLLLVRPGELILTEGICLEPVLTVTIAFDEWYPVAQGVALWQKDEGRMVFLNKRLREISRLQLPENCVGTPFLNPEGTVLYYTTGSEVKSLALDTGIDRPIYQTAGEEIILADLLHDGGVLRCTIMDGDEREAVILSAQTGEVLASGGDYESLVAVGGGFFVQLTDAPVAQLVYGTDDGKKGTIRNIEPGGTLIPVPAENTLLVQYRAEEGTRLDRYDLLTGKRTASVMLPGVSTLWDVQILEDGAVWFFCDAEGQPLCRWDTAASTLNDEKTYTAPFYTRQEPDQQGLAEMAAKLKKLEEQYGIEILMGEAVMDVVPGNYSFVPEHLVQVYENCLPVLERVLGQFPEGFFAKAMEPRGGKLKLCLLRQAKGVAEAGTLDWPQGVQFWSEQDGIMAVCLNDGLEQSLYHMLMHVIESRVFFKIPAFDTWNKLNPGDFSYDNDYIKNANRQDTQYLEGEKRYFIDMFSMSFAREDRARIFEYASMPGNEEFFASPAMQSKLKTMCEAVRKAFDLTKYQGELIWEQYLKK